MNSLENWPLKCHLSNRKVPPNAQILSRIQLPSVPFSFSMSALQSGLVGCKVPTTNDTRNCFHHKMCYRCNFAVKTAKFFASLKETPTLDIKNKWIYFVLLSTFRNFAARKHYTIRLWQQQPQEDAALTPWATTVTWWRTWTTVRSWNW
jgi:hypothetical protein